MSSAASSVEAARIGALLLRPAGRAVWSTAPNAPNRTLRKERFIARHMMIERIRPEAPSSAPATISSLLSSTKPRRRGREAGVGC